jgi:hypothetical protein
MRDKRTCASNALSELTNEPDLLCFYFLLNPANHSISRRL